MTKQQLIDTVAHATERPKKDVEAILESILAEIGKALQSRERVDLRGFGNFVIKEKKARQGRNPQTGATVAIPAKSVVTFKSSKELAERLAASAEVASV